MAHPLFDFGHLMATERAQLAVDLWDSIVLEHTSELPLPAEHRAEILRRLASRRHEPEPGVPWEDARAQIVARLDEIDAKGGR